MFLPADGIKSGRGLVAIFRSLRKASARCKYRLFYQGFCPAGFSRACAYLGRWDWPNTAWL